MLLGLLLAACTSPSPPRAGTPAPQPAAVSGAAFFADVVTKVRAQSIDNVSAGRLGEGALKGLEHLPPKGAIRVIADEQGARVTHAESGSADAELSVSWPSPAGPVSEALDEAARFTVKRLGARSQAVTDAMLRGLLSFDANGAYLGATAYNELQRLGQVGSVGLEVATHGGALTIVFPIAGGPAERAGLKAGDRILSIDGISTAGLGRPQVRALLSGQQGSQAVLSVERTEWSIPREFPVTREIVPIPTVERKMLGRVGYLEVHQLPEGAALQVRAALDALRKEGAQSLVFDLRRCPGGNLTAAIEVAELFLQDGRLILSTRGRARNQNMSFSAHARRSMLDLRLAVLIAEGTEAGCEIIGAALQDHGRAALIGTRTAGVTTIQTIIPLADGGALRLTTSRWFTPNGRSLEGHGLMPDTEIAPEEGTQRTPGDPRRDVQLRRAIDVVEAASSR
jgi:carboxyl-terminal processing protease